MLEYLAFVAAPALLTAGWLFYDVWPKQSLRLLRDDLFSVRDELFEFTSDAEDLDFEDVAYGMLRANFNGYIRFAESVSLLGMIKIGQIKPSPELQPWNERWKAYLDECSLEVKEKLLELHDEALGSVFRHALRTSLIAQVVIGYSRLADRFSGPVETAGEAYAEEHVLACAGR